MNKLSWILIIAFIIGVIILLLPDQSSPVIRFNEQHAPSSIDLAGLSLILLSWLAACTVVIYRWKRVTGKFGTVNAYLMAVLYFISLLGIGIGLAIQADILLWCCALPAFLVNAVFAIVAFRISSAK
ncbi:MAG TPA: hypothetical protein VFI06_07290 [Chitinophagaceae bacterium]|nr:hypothetical protein [Chitinophagaceae bacterium]